MSENPAWYELPAAEKTAIVQAHGDFESDLINQGKHLSSAQFRAEEAQFIEQNDQGILKVSSGMHNASPAMGGYYLISCDTMEKAVYWAERCRFLTGTNAVYPVRE
jgi:hypothetical protein